jgi:hypothetical protein
MELMFCVRRTHLNCEPEFLKWLIFMADSGGTVSFSFQIQILMVDTRFLSAVRMDYELLKWLCKWKKDYDMT